jgi:hypothetical protein
MSRRDEIIGYLEKVADALGDDRAVVVLVGGSLVGFYSQNDDVRMTEDVDLIAAVSVPAYYGLLDRLRRRGFRESQAPGSPVCRLVLADPGGGVPVDLMSADPAVQGFSNRWYAAAIEHAEEVSLPSGVRLRVITPTFLLATKLDAFQNRGNGDFGMSHDLEDIFVLLAGMPDLLEGIRTSQDDASRFVAAELRRLSVIPDFLDHVAWHFPGTPHGQAQGLALTAQLMEFAESSSAPDEI